MMDQFLGDYRLVRKLGVGGMGTVWLAAHKELSSLQVILKRLRHPDENLLARFKREAATLAALHRCPYICRMNHFFYVEGDMIIVMEFIDGNTLGELISQGRRFTVTEASRIICDVLTALEYAHEQGISHRDIKPSNIMIDHEGHVKVIDFGIAKGESDPALTAVNAFAGTPQYMAPEQFRSGQVKSYVPADLYAVGVTMYQMLTGELPFSGGNVFQILETKESSKPTSPRRLRRDIGTKLDKVILKALSKDPKKRFHSAAEMREALQIAAEDTLDDTDTRTSDSGSQSRMVLPPPRRRFPWKIAALAAAVALVAAVLLVPGLREPVFGLLSGGETDRRPSSRPSVEPPGAAALAMPRLLGPGDGELLQEGETATLSWGRVSGDRVSYRLEMSDDRDFGTSRVIAVPDTVYQFRPDLGDHFWRVQAASPAAPPSDFSGTRRIVVESAEVATTSEPPPEPAAETGRLSIGVNRASDIEIDGRRVANDRTDWNGEVETGEHTVVVKNGASREKQLSRTVDVRSDRERVETFTFSDAATGSLEVTSKPSGALVFIDGVRQSRSTPASLDLSPGSHRVKVTHGGQTQETTVNVVQDRKVGADFDFQQDARQHLTSLETEYRNRAAAISADDRASGEFDAAEGFFNQALSASSARQYSTAIEKLDTAVTLLTSIASSRADDSLAVVSTVDEFWKSLENEDIDGMRRVSRSIDLSNWQDFVDHSRDVVSVSTDLKQFTFDRSRGMAETQLMVKLSWIDSKGRSNKQDLDYRVMLHQQDSAWMITGQELVK